MNMRYLTIGTITCSFASAILPVSDYFTRLALISLFAIVSLPLMMVSKND